MTEAVRIWKQSSLHLHRLCQAHGIAYFHGTQPNQYDTGSKPLTDEERENAYWDQSPYGHIVRTGYPLLRSAGTELRDAGVRQFDLTHLFENVKETLYIDPYCHVNLRGSELIAESLARHVQESLAMHPLPDNR